MFNCESLTIVGLTTPTEDFWGNIDTQNLASAGAGSGTGRMRDGNACFPRTGNHYIGGQL